mgnify:CR=1 FL=1
MKGNLGKQEKCLLYWAIFLLAFLALDVLFLRKDNVFRWIGAARTVHNQEKQIENYKKEIAAMDEFLGRIKESKDTLETYARERFQFSEHGEDVYLIEK